MRTVCFFGIHSCVWIRGEDISRRTLLQESGVIVEDEVVLCDANDVPYTRMLVSCHCLGILHSP